MTFSRRIALLLCLGLSCSTALFGSDAAELRRQAETLSAAGIEKMNSPDESKKSAMLIAAIDNFSSALKLYKQAEDTDAICEMQANIYWCKKKMNAEDLEAYIKHRQAAGSGPLIADIPEISVSSSDTNEAHKYFVRAEKFAKMNPTKTQQIIIHWFEVADRFKDTEEGRKADKLFSSAQKKFIEDLDQRAQKLDEEKRKREEAENTLFTHRTLEEGQRSPLPSKEEQNSQITEFKNSLYKNEYANSKPEGKRILAARLYEKALITNDPAILFTLLSECIKLSIETENCWLVMTCADLTEKNFEKFDGLAAKKTAFGRMNKPYAKSALKLLENPKDPIASAMVGKHFATLKKWEGNALPLLREGDNAELKKLATLDMINPDEVGKQMEIANGWYDIAKKSSTEEKLAFLDRARHWYEIADKTATGTSKDRCTARLAEIDRINPPPITDWNSISVNQWDSLKGTLVVYDATKNRCETHMTLALGQKVRVIPHPTDKWTLKLGYYYSRDNKPTDWRGGRESTYERTTTNNKGEKTTTTYTYNYSNGTYSDGEMVAYLNSLKDKSSFQKCLGCITGPGVLNLGIYQQYYDASVPVLGTGTIRVKIIPYQELTP